MTEVIHADTTIVRTGPEWATIIRDDLSRAVEGIIAAGQHLAEAKTSVPHGEWLPMLHGIGISDGHARKLMQISQNETIANRSHVNDLPRTVTALYELSRIDPDEIEHGLEDGAIHPDTTAQEARNLAGKPPTSAFEKARKNLRALENHITGGKISTTEYHQLIADVEDVLSRVGGLKWKR